MPTDDDPEQQSGEEPADEPAAQSDAVAGNDQPDEQSDEQSTEGTDQVEQQSEDQPSSEADQQTDQGDATPSDEGDQPTEQPIQVAEAGGEPADQGGGGSMGEADNLADETVPSAGGAGTMKVSARNLKVIAEFTEEGQKFIGDILIHVFESDNGQQGRLLFQTGGQFWQDTVQKGNVITTPMLRVATSEVLIFAHARVLLPTADYQTIDSQDFKIPMPSGDTLRAKFDLTEADVEKTVNAPDADAAKAMVYQSPQLKGHLVLGDLKAEAIGNQQFRVTGKFLSGDISLL
jgi:AAA ATPase containing von Willebrand factor type A (vWA) domain